VAVVIGPALVLSTAAVFEPNLTWQLLTKRPENITALAPWGSHWPSNVWVGTSAEDQRRANERVARLLRIPAVVLFVSAEPLLGPVDLTALTAPNGARIDSLRGDVIDPRDGVVYAAAPGSVSWAICGGESGAKARPMHPEWARSLRDQCAAAGVPVFVKQDSGPKPGMQGRLPDDLWIKEFPAVVPT
jgi:protein gp37